MRLASKIFLGFSLVIVVLAAVGVFGLRAIGRLVSVNREIASETLPALRLTTGVRDSLLTMGRLEARFAILRDRRYADLWRESAAHARADLIRLTDLVHSGPEATRLTAAREASHERHEGRGQAPARGREVHEVDGAEGAQAVVHRVAEREQPRLAEEHVVREREDRSDAGLAEECQREAAAEGERGGAAGVVLVPGGAVHV